MLQISNNVGFMMVQVIKEHRQQAEEALNKLGLHVGQEIILLHLSQEEGLTQSQLAEKMGVEPPTITKMLTRMGGLVERRQDNQDARITRVYLTERSRPLEQAVLAMWQELEDRLIKGLDTDEQALLRRLLVRMYSNISEK